LNAVCLHLQVATVAKISTADGVSITKDAYQGSKSQTCPSLLTNLIRQPTITQEQVTKLWQALSIALLRTDSLVLLQPLGQCGQTGRNPDSHSD
jgi:hypothetical protein